MLPFCNIFNIVAAVAFLTGMLQQLSTNTIIGPHIREFLVFTTIFNNSYETRMLSSYWRTSVAVHNDPVISSRRINTKLVINQTRVVKTLHDQGLFLYYVQRVQNTQSEDYEKRIDFCRWTNDNRSTLYLTLFLLMRQHSLEMTLIIVATSICGQMKIHVEPFKLIFNIHF